MHITNVLLITVYQQSVGWACGKNSKRTFWAAENNYVFRNYGTAKSKQNYDKSL